MVGYGVSEPSLTEFLLARIAEDEERAQFVARQIEGSNYTPFEQWKLSWHDEYDLLCVEPSRALAECEAKRRIVEDFEVLHADYRVTHDPTTEARRLQARIAMAHLAAVYADHPDYREEWKP